jgi:hypothetical protein
LPERQNPLADLEDRPVAPEMVSSSDPDAAWAVKSGPATLGYYDNYLVDTTGRVILSVAATPARFRQEVLVAQRMIEHVSRFGIQPQNLAADKAYGSEEFLVWLLSATFSHTFRSSIVSTKHEDGSPEMRSAMSPRTTLTTVRKENRSTFEGSCAVVRAISIARRKRNAEAVHKRSYVPRVRIGDCLFIGRNQLAKLLAHWPILPITSVRNEHVIRSKPCSPS